MIPTDGAPRAASGRSGRSVQSGGESPEQSVTQNRTPGRGSTSGRRAALTLGLGVVLSALALYLAFRQIDLTELGRILLGANILLVVVSGTLMLLGLGARAWRWRYLLPEPRPGLRPLVGITGIGYMGNSLFPARAGDLIRAALVVRQERVPLAAALTSLLTEKILDSSAVVLTVMLLLMATPFPAELVAPVRAFGILVLVTLTVSALLAVAPEGFREGLLGRLPLRPGWRERISGAWDHFRTGFWLLAHPSAWPVQASLSLGVWGVSFVAYWLGLLAVGIDVPWTAVLLVVTITALGFGVPSVPGSLGIFHLLTVITLGVYAIPRSEALAAGILLHALLFLTTVGLGLFFLWTQHLSFRGLRSLRAEEP